MAVCPVCQSEIEITSQHYGTLYTCPSCRGVFFVDWGGQPEAANQEPETATSSSPDFAEAPSFENVESLESPEGFQNFDNNFSPAPHFETPQAPPAFEATPEAEENQNYDFSQPLETSEPMAIETPPSVNLDTPDLSDIADFGNADLTQSAFNYAVTIAGIDSGALRNQLQEILSDTKFGWNVIQVMAQIKGGVLTIRSMNPVKASILIQRLKYLPVKVSWRQDVLSSTV